MHGKKEIQEKAKQKSSQELTCALWKRKKQSQNSLIFPQQKRNFVLSMKAKGKTK